MHMLVMDVVRALTSVSPSGRCGRRRQSWSTRTLELCCCCELALALPSTTAVGRSGDLEDLSLFKASGAGLAVLSLAM